MWIKLHQSLLRHPKLFRLATELGVSRQEAFWHLISMWLWAMEYAPDGDIGGFSEKELAAGADWHKDAQLFNEKLLCCGFVDETKKIHDWNTYGGKFYNEMVRNRKKQKEYRKRSRYGNVTVTLPAKNGYVTGQNRIEENRKETNKTNAQTAALELPMALKPFESAITEWLAYKRERGQTYKPRGLKALYAECLKLGAGLPAAIQNSMARNYAGIFAASNSGRFQPPRRLDGPDGFPIEPEEVPV